MQDAANSGDEGEKKVTFNETTEEKDYTKDKELDEEGSVIEDAGHFLFATLILVIVWLFARVSTSL